MKHILTTSLILVLLCLLQPGTAQAQSASDAQDQAIQAVRAGDADALGKLLNKRVDISVPPNANGGHDANQTVYILKQFFMSYPIKDFNVMHKGSAESSHYIMGTYISNKGTFDTNIFIKKFGDSFKIDQIRFDSDN